MNRRDFLIRMFGAAVAVPLAYSLGLPNVEPPSGAAWDSTLFAANREAWRIYQECLADIGFPITEIISEERLLGDRTASGVLVTDQYSVSVSREMVEPSITAAMVALSNRAARQGLDSYVKLSNDLRGPEYVSTVGALRMVSVYNVIADDMLVRFDVIGGSSPVGQAHKRRYKADMLKREIRRRLGTHHVVPIPV